MRRYQNQIELLQGTLDLLILQTPQWGPQHGYSMARSINITSGDVLEVDAGSLYPALHRLERQGWVKSRWKQSENQQRVFRGFSALSFDVMAPLRASEMNATFNYLVVIGKIRSQLSVAAATAAIDSQTQAVNQQFGSDNKTQVIPQSKFGALSRGRGFGPT